MTETQPATGMPHLTGVTHRWVEVGGISLHVAEMGRRDGEPLLLLHGLPQHWWQWHGVMPALADRYRVLALDWRGFGWSDAPADGYTQESFIADLVGLLGELGLPRVKVLAHDWGAIVAQLLAIQRPELVERLMVMGCPDLMSVPSAGALIKTLPIMAMELPLLVPALAVRRMSRGNQDMVTTLLTAHEPDRSVSAEDIAVYKAQMRDPARVRASSAMYRGFLLPIFAKLIGRRVEGDLTMPTYVLLGEMDPSTDMQLGGHLPGRGSAVTQEIIPGAGHFLPDYSPELVAERALAFFAEG